MKVGDLVSYREGDYLADLIGIVMVSMEGDNYVRVRWINGDKYNLRELTTEWKHELRVLNESG